MRLPPRAHLTTRAVIFDLDGVLLWTLPMHWWAFQRTFEAEGKEFSYEDYLRYGLGNSRGGVIRSVLGHVPDAKLQELMDAKQRHVQEYLDTEGIRPIPGSIDFVRAARDRNLKTAVASASRMPRHLLEAAGSADLFDVIVDRGMVARSKPHPDVFLLTAEKLAVPPGECLVIEDSAVGVEAGRAAGMRVLALATTHDRSELSQATAVYGGFDEIPRERWLA